MKRPFDEDLEELRTALRSMGSEVESMLEDAARVMGPRDRTVVDSVIARDAIVDRMEREAGAPARGLVTASHSSSGPEDQSILGLRVASVEADGSQKSVVGEAQSADVETSTRDSATRTAATIATGTAAGAVIGQILGRDTRSTVSGAAIGTAVGVGVALTTRGGHAELPTGSRIVVRLSQDLTY